MLYAAECRRLIGPAIFPGFSFINIISATSILLSSATWSWTIARIITRSGETTFPLSHLDLPVSICHCVKWNMLKTILCLLVFHYLVYWQNSLLIEISLQFSIHSVSLSHEGVFGASARFDLKFFNETFQCLHGAFFGSAGTGALKYGHFPFCCKQNSIIWSHRPTTSWNLKGCLYLKVFVFFCY